MPGPGLSKVEDFEVQVLEKFCTILDDLMVDFLSEFMEETHILPMNFLV